MSRRSIVKKRYVLPDSQYNSFLVSLLTARILKKGKKRLADSIVSETFSLVKEKTEEELQKYETDLIDRFGELPVQAIDLLNNVPLEVSRYRGTTLALRWIIQAAKDRSGRTMSLKLASEGAKIVIV